MAQDNQRIRSRSNDQYEYDVTMTLNGTTAVEQVLDVIKPIEKAGCSILVTGDVDTATITVSAYHSGLGFTTGEADFLSQDVVVDTDQRAHAMVALLEQINDAKFVLPKGQVTFRAVSDNAGSTGAVTLKIATNSA
jgi:hypothetical protein